MRMRRREEDWEGGNIEGGGRGRLGEERGKEDWERRKRRKRKEERNIGMGDRSEEDCL